MKREWIQSDDNQFIYKVSDSCFYVIDISNIGNAFSYDKKIKYTCAFTKINLDDHSKDSLLEYGKFFMSNSFDLDDLNNTDSQIIAEWIAETDFWDFKRDDFEKTEGVENWLKEKMLSLEVDNKDDTLCLIQNWVNYEN